MNDVWRCGQTVTQSHTLKSSTQRYDEPLGISHLTHANSATPPWQRQTEEEHTYRDTQGEAQGICVCTYLCVCVCVCVLERGEEVLPCSVTCVHTKDSRETQEVSGIRLVLDQTWLHGHSFHCLFKSNIGQITQSSTQYFHMQMLNPSRQK